MKTIPDSCRFAGLAAVLLLSVLPSRVSAQNEQPKGAGPPGASPGEVSTTPAMAGGADAGGATTQPGAGATTNQDAAAMLAAQEAQKSQGGATVGAAANGSDLWHLTIGPDLSQVPASAVSPGATFAAGRPFMWVTLSYRFAAPLDPGKGTYFVHCMRVGAADSSPDWLGYKNLDAEWHSGVISGAISFRLQKLATWYGDYSFRFFGPHKVMVDASTLPSPVPIPPGVKSVEVVQPGKIHDEGRFPFGPYQTAITVPAETPPRRRLTITWADASVHPDAGIGLFKSGMDNQHAIARMMFANLPGSWQVDAPAELGNYEVRAFIDGGLETTGTRPFKVTWGTLQPVLSGFPATCYPFAYMPIDYANAPAEINAWIGIFDVTNNGTNTGWSHEDLQGKTSGELYVSAPATSGRYDIRMFDSSNNLLARSAPFQVIAGSESILLKAAVDSGRIVLTWNNPRGYQELDGYFVYRGTAPGAESPTPLTLGPIPADRSAAAATAVNTHTDSGAQPGTRYYYVVKPLQMDHTTLGTASNEVSATVSAPPATADAGSGGGGSPGGGSIGGGPSSGAAAGSTPPSATGTASGSGETGQPSTGVAASSPSTGKSSTGAPTVASAGAAGTTATPSAPPAAQDQGPKDRSAAGIKPTPSVAPAAQGRVAKDRKAAGIEPTPGATPETTTASAANNEGPQTPAGTAAVPAPTPSVAPVVPKHLPKDDWRAAGSAADSDKKATPSTTQETAATQETVATHETMATGATPAMNKDTAGTKETPSMAPAAPNQPSQDDWKSAGAKGTPAVDKERIRAPAAVPGATAEFKKARRLGETDALVFAMKSAEYEAGRLTFGDDWIAPQLGEKLLVVHFHVTNPQREPVQFTLGRFQWLVVDAQGAAINAPERVGMEADPALSEQTLLAGGSCDGMAVFRVPGAGEMQSITVTNLTVTGRASARIDLRGQVRALPARYAAPSDGGGATVTDMAEVQKGEMFPCGKFDVVLQAVETAGGDAVAGAENEQGTPVYATVRYTLRDAHAGGVFGAGAPVVMVVDSLGGAHAVELQTFELKEPASTELTLAPGGTAEFRVRCWIPRSAAPREVIFQERGGIPVRIDLGR